MQTPITEIKKQKLWRLEFLDQKRHKAVTIDNTTHDESFEARKLIPAPETTEKSTKLQKRKRLNRIFLEKNLEKQPATMKRVQIDLSHSIKNFQIEDWMLKICLPKCKKEH